MKYQYVTILSHCHLTKHDTILSKLGEPVVLTKDMNRDKRYGRFPLHSWKMKTEMSSKEGLKFKGMWANCVLERKFAAPLFLYLFKITIEELLS